MAVIITGEDYEKNMDIDCYMNFVYENPNPAMAEMVEFLLQSLHKIFADGKIKGHQLLDIGSGVAIHSVLSASNNVNEIYLSDYSKRHIDILKKWQKGEVQIQEKQVKRVCEIENKGQTVEDRVAQLRKKVKGIAYIDVTKPNSLTGCEVPKQFDVVTSCWCLDSAGQSLEAYRKCAENIFSLVKPGGFFVLFGSIECTQFTIDNNDTFPNANISEAELRKSYEDAGFEILAFQTSYFSQADLYHETSFAMCAHKNSEHT